MCLSLLMSLFTLSSATVVVLAGDCFWLKPVAMVLFMLYHSYYIYIHYINYNTFPCHWSGYTCNRVVWNVVCGVLCLEGGLSLVAYREVK